MSDRVHRPRVGLLFLGCGRAAAMHSRTLRRIGDVELSYASRGRERADNLCARYGGRRAFASYDAGLADPEVSVALVATPTYSHLELALLALAAGKHVIVEKPAFLRAADADVVAAAAAAAGRLVFVAENYAYKPVTTFIERLVLAGDLGDVRFVTINATKHQPAVGWRADPALSGGGALFEGGIHWVSFAASFGLDVETVHAFRATAPDVPERSTLVVLRYANGAMGTLAHSWEIPAPFGGLRLSKVQGTAGAVTFESNGLFAVATGRRRALRIPAFNDPLGYRAMFTDFLRVLTSREQPRYTLDRAKRDLELIEEAERSAAEGIAPLAAAIPPIRQ